MHTHILLVFLFSFAHMELRSQILLDIGDDPEMHETVFSIECSNDSTGLIPLTDLGTNYYHHVQGGLYASGINELHGAHRKNGITISKSLKPLDTVGNVDFENGKILALGLGASVASNMFNAYIDSIQAEGFEGMSECVKLRGMFVAGQDLADMVDTENTEFWAELKSKMSLKNHTYSQVQILWILQHSDDDTSSIFEIYHESVVEKYTKLMQMLKDTLPNLKQVYLSGMHYTGYMSTVHKRYDAYAEPKGYWGNLAIKEVIQKQIQGDTSLTYLAGDVKSAWIGWGPYLWADGVNVRAYDGLSWSCDQFRSDSTGGGFHLIDDPNGFGIEASMLKSFFETNPVTSIWYNDAPQWKDCGVPVERLSANEQSLSSVLIYPNPVNGDFTIVLPEDSYQRLQIKIYNDMGLCSYYKEYAPGTYHQIQMENDLPNGIYFLEIISDSRRYISKMVVLK